MLKRLIGLFIIFSPFTSYFAFSAWFRLPVILLLLVYIFFSIKILHRGKISTKFLFIVNISDIILLLLLITIVFSSMLNYTENRAFSHTIASVFVFLMYFVLLKKIIDFENLDYTYILKMFAISSFICGAIIIVDWILINYYNIGFRGYFVRVDHKLANMLYYQKPYFVSVGGVAEEPGSMALLMNIIAPLGMLYYKIKRKYWILLFLFGTYLLSMIFLSSSAGIICLCMAILVAFLHRINFKWHLRKNLLLLYTLLFVLAIGIIFYITYTYNGVVIAQINEIKTKVFLSDRNSSSHIRSYVWKEAIINWLNNPFFGNGPGASISEYIVGYHSVYLTFLADTGIISLLLFLLFLFIAYKKIVRIKAVNNYYLMIPFMSVAFHFAVIGDFYHAPFWILLIVIHMIYKKERTNNENIGSYTSI